MKTVCFHPEAETEMMATASYYESRQADLGKRFLASVQEALNRIAINPRKCLPPRTQRALSWRNKIYVLKDGIRQVVNLKAAFQRKAAKSKIRRERRLQRNLTSRPTHRFGECAQGI